MAKINTPDDLFEHFTFSNECKIAINQLYNTHQERFFRPFLGICSGIKRQAKEVLENEYEYPKGTFYVKTPMIKVVYKKDTLEIVNVVWQDKQ